jgi:hypothetical protein
LVDEGDLLFEKNNMFKSLFFLLCTSKSFALIIFSLGVTGCKMEDLKLENTDANETSASQNISPEPVTKIPGLIPGEPMNPQVMDLLLQKYVGEIIDEISNAIPDSPVVDYDRLEGSFLKMLLESKAEDEGGKYQFICDENERWIYRCNMESGEIECFSMSSNKLRLISSIK